MSHFLLSDRPDSPGSPLDGRYADEATTLIFAALMERGVNPEQCVAKLFGGGSMFPLHRRGEEESVGERNGLAARQLMRDRGIRVVSESLFGVGYRRIIFDIDTGDVWSRQVDPAVASSRQSAR